MGWSISWAAVRDRSVEEVWQTLGLRPTGRKWDEPEGPFCSTTLPGGWIVVCAFHDDLLVKDSAMSSLSARGEAVGCWVEEHVMFSQAVGWKDCARRWSVTHDPERSRNHLDAQGELPLRFAAVNAAARARPVRDRSQVDLVFDVPADVAKTVVGFRHDEFDGLVFEELESLRPVERPQLPFTPAEIRAMARRGPGQRWRITPFGLLTAVLAAIGAIVFIDRLVGWLRSL